MGRGEENDGNGRRHVYGILVGGLVVSTEPASANYSTQIIELTYYVLDSEKIHRLHFNNDISTVVFHIYVFVVVVEHIGHRFEVVNWIKVFFFLA